MTEKIKIVLNGKNVEGFKGETIYECATRHGYEIPTLCHDPRIEPYSSCYVCVVEVAGMRGHQPSCSTFNTPVMEVVTDSDELKNSRKTALDLLLSNHYADCMAPCKQTCPAGVDVQGYISLIDKGRYSEAVALIKETNPLPAICGRVCVRPCEAACRRNLMEEGAAVGIDYLKRFAADNDLASSTHYKPVLKADTGKKVAVIGAGPGGLSTAWFLRLEGHSVDIFEAAPKPGGWLRYGIPEYRLPNDLLDLEVKNITDLGVAIHYNKKLGHNLSYQTIQKDFDATVLTIGSQKGTSVGCQGDDAENVFSGIDFLRNMEMTGQRYDFSGKTVVVVGGGNTAMDCCRTSIRCNAEKVYVVYRRTEKEMPANPIEIHESKLEGVEYLFLTNPNEIIKDEKGVLKSMMLSRMTLGEPDASGRRRPIPMPGSEFELRTDYVLAAIGQKTDVNFIDNINAHAEGKTLKLTRWGDIEAEKNTLQTGIPSVFAAGDGVSGPATIIEAIAQAKIAARSCDQFLHGESLSLPVKEFLSKRDNFKTQLADDYKHKYEHRHRHEMPVLDPSMRLNFSEVELGYANETIAREEAQRCLECGCTEYYTCDLKKHSTAYEAEQKNFAGDFQEYELDFRHPFIEFDNNKCILCSRCIRICREVVGAGALGLVNRGFKSYVSPALGLPLQETSCESCGMCITTCPTAAITENFPFKPGPLKLEKIEAIDPFGSEGFEVDFWHHNGLFYKSSPRTGNVNTFNYINRNAMFGYKQLNMPGRIRQPLLKKDNVFVPISYKEAYELIVSKIKSVEADENAFFGGSGLSNEELYLVQKLARAGAQTNNVSSFHYMGRGDGYFYNSAGNAGFDEINGATKIFVAGGELQLDHPVVNHLIYNHKHRKNVEVIHITTHENALFSEKADRVIHCANYFWFAQAVSYCIVSKGEQNQLFIDDRTLGFAEWTEQLLKNDFALLCQKAGVNQDVVTAFAQEYNDEMNALLILQEKEVSSNGSLALHHLAHLTGKTGKSSNGLIALKEGYNAHGIFDMGVCHKIGPGAVSILDDKLQQMLKNTWKVDQLPFTLNSVYKHFTSGRMKNAFIFGEDPLGCALNRTEVKQWFNKLTFVVVQDFTMTKTAEQADLILPASFIWESGGSVTNTLKQISWVEEQTQSIVDQNRLEQLASLLHLLGVESMAGPFEIMKEWASLLPQTSESKKYRFVAKDNDNFNRQFSCGCNALQKETEQMYHC